MWDRAIEGKDSSIIVPIDLKLVTDSVIRTIDGTPLNGNIWLYAKKKNNHWTFTMWTLIPSNGDKVNFTGTLLSEDYFEGLVTYTSYANGKIVENKEIVIKENLVKGEKLARLTGDKMANWNYDCTTRMYTICVGNPKNVNDADVCNTRHETICGYNWKDEGFSDNQEMISWIDFSNNDDGGSLIEKPNYDCARILNGSAYIGECGVCIGGTTGILSCLDLIDNLEGYPCAQNLLNQLPNCKNDIAFLIKSQFVGNQEFNITFRAKELPQNVDGFYNPNSNNMFNSTITLNADMLSNSSKEYILVTMYHEALHSVLNLEEKRLTPTEFAIKYPNLSRTYNNQMPRYYFNHNGFPSFIKLLADAIVSFNPNIPFADAVILSKTGIVNNMSNSELLLNESYRNGSKGQKGKIAIRILILFFSINLCFAQKYFVLENNTDNYQNKNYELNTLDLYGINKKVYLYNILLEDKFNKSNTEKTLVLFAVLPNSTNDEDWELINLDSINNKIISTSELRQLSERSLLQRDDLQYGVKTKYWNEYKIIVKYSGKYYLPKNCLLQFYSIQNRLEILNQPYNTINIFQNFHTLAEVKELYANNPISSSFPINIPPNDKYFETLRDRREFLSKKFSINLQTYYQFWTLTDWGKITSKAIKDPHKIYFAYERGIDRFAYNHTNLIVGGSFDFYFYHYKNEFGIDPNSFQSNILNEKIMIARNILF